MVYFPEDKISCLKNQVNLEDNSDNKNKELENCKKKLINSCRKISFLYYEYRDKKSSGESYL